MKYYGHVDIHMNQHWVFQLQVKLQNQQTVANDFHAAASYYHKQVGRKKKKKKKNTSCLTTHDSHDLQKKKTKNDYINHATDNKDHQGTKLEMV